MAFKKRYKYVKGRARHVPGVMNKSEAKYASEVLEPLIASGDVIRYVYEPFALRLAPKTTYTPDFLVVKSDGALEIHEFKGFWEDDARVKIKVAAKLFPEFYFKGITRKAGQYKYEDFAPS